MLQPNKKKPTPPWVVWVFLALVCMIIAELAVCRVADPVLFYRITDPVVQTTQMVVQNTKHAAIRLWGKVSDVVVSIPTYLPELPEWGQKEVEQAEEPEVIVQQLAGEPSVITEQEPEDSSVTKFTIEGELETLSGGLVDLVYYNQGEEPWASGKYGPDSISGYGCGPTAMAMIVSSLSGELVNPIEMAQLAYEAGYCAPGSGSYLSIVEGIAERFGLTIEEWEVSTPQSLYHALVSGHMFVALMGKGHFTNSGHFIVLRGVTLNGKILVGDPNSRDRSLIAWDPELILSELSSNHANGGPLWCFNLLGQNLYS